MEVFYTVDLGAEKHKVKVVCGCGKCALVSANQLEDLRMKVKAYQGSNSPEKIEVICN